MGNGKNDDEKHVGKSNGDDPMNEAEANASAEIAAASTNIKLQPFWVENPENWFLLAEIQFEIQQIRTERQKYQQVLPALPANTFNNLTDLLRNPPKENQYTYLKNLLLNRLAPSDEKQLETLLSGRDIGDRRPSEVLRHIRELARDNFPDKMIRSLWARKMPNIIRIALAAQPETITTNALAETADRMFEAMSIEQQQQQITTLSRESRPRNRSSPISGRSEKRLPITNNITIEDRLARIEARLDRITMAKGNRSNSRSRERRYPSRARPRSISRSRSSNTSGNYRPNNVCWYHLNYGTLARKCNKPCHFGQSTSAMDVDHQKN